MKKLKTFKKINSTQKLSAIVIVLAITSMGLYYLTNSHANGPYTSAKADSGTVVSPAAKQTCTGSSDGNCVVFGSSTSPPTQCPCTTAPAMTTAVPSGYTRAFTEDFNTPAAVGQFDNVYGSLFGEYSGAAPQPDGSQAAYVPTEVMSVANGSMYYDLHHDSSGTPVAAAPQPGPYFGFEYGQVGMSVRLDSVTGGEGYKIAFLMWPTSGNWTNEVDFAEAQTNFAQDLAISSLITNDEPNFDQSGNSPDTGVNLLDGKYHTFLVTWTPTQLTESIDGVQKANFSAAGIPQQQMRVSLQAEGQLNAGAIPSGASATVEVPYFYINTYN